MLDLRFVRENPEIVKENIKKKFQDQKLPLVDEVIELDKLCRAAKGEADELRGRSLAFARTFTRVGIITSWIARPGRQVTNDAVTQTENE